MKRKRKAKILEIINNFEIETQEELQSKLRDAGFEVTQATISRDIRELRLVKEQSESGRYIYSAGKKNYNDNMAGRFISIFSESILSVDYALNTVCVKCFSGTANAACAAIDSTQWSGVVGTIAGDDTIFVLCKTEEFAKNFTLNLEKSINAENS